MTISALSSLTCSYASLSSSTDGLDLSSGNGATWIYMPVAGGNIRIKTGGSQTPGDSFSAPFPTVVR